jgi:hypothetical protein
MKRNLGIGGLLLQVPGLLVGRQPLFLRLRVLALEQPDQTTHYVSHKLLLLTHVKGTVAWDGFLTISLYPRYKIRMLNFAFFSVFG